jgi:hypothetical protein
VDNIGVLILLFALFCFAMYFWSSHKIQRAKQATRQFIFEQAPVFARRRAQLLYTDAYGTEQATKWEKEKKYILSKVIPEHLSKSGHSQDSIWRATKENFWSPSQYNPTLAAIEKAALTAKPGDLISRMSQPGSNMKPIALRHFGGLVGKRG